MPTLATLGIGLGATAASSLINKPDDSAQKAQVAANQRAQAFIEQAAAEASSQSQKLFGSAEQNILSGNQAALDVMRGVLPQQISAMTQGGQNAQQQIAAGLPQIQAALMGTPIDFSAFQPRQVSVDTSFMPQTLAPATNIGQTLQPQAGDPVTNAQILEAMQGIPSVQGGGSIRDLQRRVAERNAAIFALPPDMQEALAGRGVVAGEGEKLIDVFSKAMRGL